MQVTCPSGLSGNIRSLSVAESELFTDRKLQRDGTLIDKIIARVWESTIDAGPYQLDSDGIPYWDNVLLADRFYIVMMGRVATYGPDYEFRVSCPSCRAAIEWAIDLLFLPIKKVPNATLEKIVIGDQLYTELNGKRIQFKLLDGKAERKLGKALRTSNSKLITVLAQRIVEVDGEKNKMNWIRNLPLGDGMELIALFDDQDGGVETEIEIECPDCGSVEQVNLPFDKVDFWLPKRKVR